MEWIFADIINSTKVPKVVKYIAITLLVGFLEFLFITIAINGVSKFAMPVGISLAIIFFIVYIYLIIKIKFLKKVELQENNQYQNQFYLIHKKPLVLLLYLLDLIPFHERNP